MDLVDYWVDHPPVHVSVRGFFPRKKQPQQGIRLTSEEQLKQALAESGYGNV
jgi:hypothetical protein